ncbi:MAG TPA: hypothetical protein VGX51_02380 [Solirubrobacteraceae bacterium]|jgi:hypothetical protein|nr:hypothetical protein [Solirubrobacteraceae bacterium]
METLTLTDQQGLCIAELPEDYRVVGIDRSAPLVRKPTGELMRIQQDGRLTTATITAKARLTARRPDQVGRVDGDVMASTPYTSVMD